MNLIAGLLILACLFGSELLGASAAEDIQTRLLAICLTALTVPGMAFFQTAVLIKKIHAEDLPLTGKQSLCRRMTISHAAVWLSASLAIIWALRWQDIVRGNWQLDRWPLIDELVILLPVIVPMTISWAIFYELQQVLNDSNPKTTAKKTLTHSSPLIQFWNQITSWKQTLQPRLSFVSIRFRLYFLLILIPLCLFVSIKDLVALSHQLPDWVAMGLYSMGAISLLLLFPFLLLVVWKTAPIKNRKLDSRLRSICRENRLHVFDIRVWNTRDQIVNAVVAGMVPKFRVILISDGLIKQFPSHEIEAVLRHEAGHLRLWHLPTRLFFMILPLLIFAAADFKRLIFETPSISWLEPTGILLLSIAGIYLWFIVRWLSHQMEHEADLFSVFSRASQSSESDDQYDERAQDMSDALLRLAAISPNQYQRNSYFHPSLRRRLEFLHGLQTSADAANQFQRQFAKRRLLLAGLALAATIAIVAMV